ncbi:queuosine precursor transporter [Lutibacter sp. TH_r2]|uniref:queuosine precursor transporter n=1 Tax=Lutibacter sp. TH_r2 TaxID=3082083 RepID=UPI002953A1B3|nr:queuosine precursor transporter [Lutibacter sp. TH_r2]MDV7186980.1 queuosine precursor transporter [Lutibacter sp. TH_r2]
MNNKLKSEALTIYLILASMFIAALVASNLIFQKFFYWNPFGWFRFELSVGILPYPITFLITDIISEIYGRKKANQVVVAGIFASFFSMLIVLVANFTPAIDGSPINNEIFTKVFGLSPIAVLASMLAYLFAQFIDIKIFHFWKRKTNGKHLWLRNNFSTFSSQLVDTLTVVTLLCIFKVIPWSLFYTLIISGFLFKILIALLDTPILYFIVYLFRSRFNLKEGEEIKIH